MLRLLQSPTNENKTIQGINVYSIKFAKRETGSLMEKEQPTPRIPAYKSTCCGGSTNIQ